MLHKTKPTGKTQKPHRRAAIAPFAALLMVPLGAMVAFSVDYGFLHESRASLQRAADAAALAAVRDLVPEPDGTQDLSVVRATARQYARENVVEVPNFVVLDGDIVIGRYEPETVYTNFTILDDGIFDTVRVTLRRDSLANGPVQLFFARILGFDNSNVSATATAILQKGGIIPPGVGVLPFSIPQQEWLNTDPGDTWSVYADSTMVDNYGDVIPGNWGTLDIGSSSNSTSDIVDQILNGLQQTHLDQLYYDEDRIPQPEYIDSACPWTANGDPGLSSGIKSAINESFGTLKYIPIYDNVGEIPPPAGGQVEFHVSGWAVCEVVDANWKGAQNSYVTVKKCFKYDGLLRPQMDLSKASGYIEGAYTTPVLVQ